MRTRRRVCAVPAIVVLGWALLASCATTASSTDGGGTLRIGLDYSPTCLDPQQTGQSPNLGVVESLTRQEPDHGTIEPALASGWRTNVEATVFTFRIKDGVRFSDGTALDARVVKANLDHIAALGGKASGGGIHLTGLAGVLAPDTHTVEVRFHRPNVSFLQASSTSAFGILAPGTLATPPAQRCAGKIVGTGPYVLTGYLPRQRIELTRRTDHKGRTGTQLDRVEIRIIPESSTRIGSLRSGQIDVATAIAPQNEPVFDSAGFTLMSRAVPGIGLGLFVNERKPILADPVVRKAIQRSINRSDVVDVFLSERYRPASSVLSAVTPGYVDLSQELAPDPAVAGAWLDAAGWRVGPDGFRARDGSRLSVDVVFGKPQGLELVQQQLRGVGIDLRLRQLQISELQAQLSAGNYDFFLGDSSRADPDVLRSDMITGKLVGAGELTRALDTAASTADPGRRAVAVARAQRLLVTEAHVIPINEQTQVIAASRKVHGLSFTAESDFRLDDVWLG